MFISPAYAQTTDTGGGLIELFAPLLIVFVIIYFMILRPQQKRQKEHRAMVDNIKRGDKIVTQGGLIGKVAKIDDAELEVEIASGVKIKVVRSMVISVTPKAGKNTKTDKNENTAS